MTVTRPDLDIGNLTVNGTITVPGAGLLTRPYTRTWPFGSIKPMGNTGFMATSRSDGLLIARLAVRPSAQPGRHGVFILAIDGVSTDYTIQADPRTVSTAGTAYPLFTVPVPKGQAIELRVSWEQNVIMNDQVDLRLEWWPLAGGQDLTVTRGEAPGGPKDGAAHQDAATPGTE
ncbi:hypothetical protein AB0D08_28010 [Kitasatospora sp. NPDC048540]|uniref:hypothetical protein n=1 Tax=Kitasatospora sp. NPDC048540 TaxID=3155634 RepID=UPI0033D97917